MIFNFVSRVCNSVAHDFVFIFCSLGQFGAIVEGLALAIGLSMCIGDCFEERLSGHCEYDILSGEHCFQISWWALLYPMINLFSKGFSLLELPFQLVSQENEKNKVIIYKTKLWINRPHYQKKIPKFLYNLKKRKSTFSSTQRRQRVVLVIMWILFLL